MEFGLCIYVYSYATWFFLFLFVNTSLLISIDIFGNHIHDQTFELSVSFVAQSNGDEDVLVWKPDLGDVIAGSATWIQKLY